jgi:hypothetical protein
MMYGILVVDMDVYGMWVLYDFLLFEVLKWYICKCLSMLQFQPIASIELVVVVVRRNY